MMINNAVARPTTAGPKTLQKQPIVEMTVVEDFEDVEQTPVKNKLAQQPVFETHATEAFDSDPKHVY